jgi:hypothetical protein
MREARRVRTRFGGIEEILGGRERFVGRLDSRAVLELIIASWDEV